MIFNYVIVGLGEPLTLPGILILIVRNGILVFILVKVIQMILKPGDLVAEHEI
jgi:hypothetical protein